MTGLFEDDRDERLLRRMRVEGLLAEPALPRCVLTRPTDEASLLRDIIERGDAKALSLVVLDDFTTPAHRALFRHLESAGDQIVDIDDLIDALAARFDTVREVIVRSLAGVLHGGSDWSTTTEEKARRVHGVGKLRRVFDAFARAEADAVHVARGLDFDADSHWRALCDAVRVERNR